MKYQLEQMVQGANNGLRAVVKDWNPQTKQYLVHWPNSGLEDSWESEVELEKLKVKDQYPAVFAFFDGAFSANSGGRATEKDFERYSFSLDRLNQAESELKEFCDPMGLSYRALGMMADSGYTVSGQTMQDDDVHELMVYELLDEVY